MTRRDEDLAREPEAKEDDDRSLTDKVKDKVEEVLDPPEAADYEPKTNPVTGQRRTG